MAVNFAVLVYLPNFDMFARSITVTPLASQPGGDAYTKRGIFNTVPINVGAEDGSILSDQQTILDILDAEFSTLPEQLDQIHIPADPSAGVALGDYEVTHTETNGVGQTTLYIRKLLPPLP